MFAFGMIFKNSMRVYLVVSALTSLVCYLLVQLTIYLGGNEIGIYTLLSFIVGLTLYLSPLTFARATIRFWLLSRQNRLKNGLYTFYIH